MAPITQCVRPLYLSVSEAVELVRKKGLENCIAAIADHIYVDFLRWNDCNKSARVASYSRHGVIELMPISDDALYSFKYANGHPKKHRAGLADRDGLRACSKSLCEGCCVQKAVAVSGAPMRRKTQGYLVVSRVFLTTQTQFFGRNGPAQRL